ncbi:MAG: hypothetical protein IJP04_03085 [Clostridia bacterium]|nr:hypothetical protein [Clostridia bacterium]
MKLKDRPLEWWKGKKYTYWCRADVNDTRKINYILRGMWGWEEHEEHFTSEDDVDCFMLHRVQSSIITKLELINNEWFVELEY